MKNNFQEIGQLGEKPTLAKAHKAIGTFGLVEFNLVELNLEFGSLIDK